MKIHILIAALTTMYASIITAQTAKLQVIHNAADKAAAKVDVYVGAMKAFDDFAFQTATPFVSLPAGVPLVIGIAPGTSTSVADTIATFTVTLEANGTYQAIANGVLTPNKFAANPNQKSIGFNLFALPSARTIGTTDSLVDIRVFHGVTDAPAVDVSTANVKLVPNLEYGKSSMYLQVPENVYKLDIAPTGGQTLVSYTADVKGLKGKAITIIASGFLNPAENGDGSAFGLYVITADGGPFQALPVAATPKIAKVRIVHNAADPAAAKVDLYVNGAKAIDDFAFRTSTPTLELNVGTTYEIGVAPGTSASAKDTLKSFTVSLPEGNFVVFANGVIQQGFVPNPSGANIGFTIFPIANVSVAASNPNNIDVIVFHGATDAPAVDVYAGGNNVSAGTKVISNLAYGQKSEKLSVPGVDFKVSIAPTGGPELAAFSVPGAMIKGQSVIVFASGFLNPAANLNGQAFGLFALVGETVVQLPSATTSVDETLSSTEPIIAPNPANGMMTARFSIPHDAPVQVRIHNVTGAMVNEMSISNAAAGEHILPFDMSNAIPGTYHMTIDAGSFRTIVPFSVIR